MRRAIRFEAWRENELVGLVAAYLNRPELGTAFITSVSVDAALRGSAVASRLIQMCLDQAAASGHVRAELRAAAANAPALRLYAQYGFEPRGGEGEELVLRRELSAPSRGNGQR